ncbi:MAG: ABC transporter permease subunit [Streptosporangiales bacterium]|nr:ABC transporter permease subunit [Streptosporangiales bacterium]
MSSQVLAAVGIPQIPVGDVFADLIDWMTETFEATFEGIESVVSGSVEGLNGLLNAIPPIALIVVLALLGTWLRGWKFGLFSLLGLGLIVSMETWAPAMETLSLVLVASVIAVALAIPIGILASQSEPVGKVVKPILDFMQTMPAFVYLIPMVSIFSIGPVPGVVATVVFAMPPGVRLTELGIRQVDREMVEAGEAFGASREAILTRIQIPLALPSIMAGVNQVIMLSLSMVVIAGMVGAGGLGGVVYQGITRLDVGLGFEGGLAVVLLAIFLDRVTAALGNRSAVARARRTAAKV